MLVELYGYVGVQIEVSEKLARRLNRIATLSALIDQRSCSSAPPLVDIISYYTKELVTYISNFKEDSIMNSFEEWGKPRNNRNNFFLIQFWTKVIPKAKALRQEYQCSIK